MKTALIHLPLRFVAVLLVLSLASLSAEARTYRWTDADGNVVYSQTPPPDGRESTTVGAPPPPAESPEEARQRLQQQLDQFQARREAERQEKQQAAEDAKAAEQNTRACEMARHNFEALSQGSRHMFRNPDGSYSRLSEEEVIARREEARTFIERSCQ